MRIGFGDTGGLAMMAEQRAQCGGGHARSPCAPLEADEQSRAAVRRTFEEEVVIEYQVRLAWDRLCADAWQWKWVIILIAVELWRLHLDAQYWSDSTSCLGGIASDLSNLLDAVDPHGPRGDVRLPISVTLRSTTVSASLVRAGMPVAKH
jgi:hypothetical protein